MNQSVGPWIARVMAVTLVSVALSFPHPAAALATPLNDPSPSCPPPGAATTTLACQQAVIDDPRGVRALITGVVLDGRVLPVDGLFLLTPSEGGTYTASASVGCNAYATTVRREQQRLSIVDSATGWVSTLVACDRDRARAESAMAAVLTGTELQLEAAALRSTTGALLLYPLALSELPETSPTPPLPTESATVDLVPIALLLLTVGGGLALLRRRSSPLSLKE